MKTSGPIEKELVLLGGGHAHVHVLTAFAKRPEAGLRITLVTAELETPYSGMLPGQIAGLYSHDETHIDLQRLAAVTGTRLIHARACGLDRTGRYVLLEGRPPLAYDLLSINVGITPRLDGIEGAQSHAVAVKPIGTFEAKLTALLARFRAPGGPRRFLVAGGGAGGVELVLSLRHRLLLEAEAAKLSLAPGELRLALATGGELLPSHAPAVRETLRRILAEKAITLYEQASVVAVSPEGARLEDGGEIPAEEVLLATNAAAPPWFSETGLALDPQGFLAVGPTLQSLNDPLVFAAGDCATLVKTPREKAGVYAVRAGPPLARNLRAVARGKRPRPWRPQSRHLALIGTGERYAIASRGGLKLEGAWAWRLKEWIDRRWMRMYQDAEGMAHRMARRAKPRPPPKLEEMRCGGCAAKVGPGPLSHALARLEPRPVPEELILGLDAPDDAVAFRPRAGRDLLQSVDFFRAFVSDPFIFGEIAAAHALNDIFAMGGEPRYALATAVVAQGAARVVEDQLFQMLSGARRCFDAEGVALAGGHSSEGEELALGFTVTGEADPGNLLRKGGLKDGNLLILTRPLGTGILFAAQMRGKARAQAVAAALDAMRRSNADAARCLIQAGARAMTDVTGFGLAGHLGEMLAASGVSARLDLAALPLYPQVAALARAGTASTLLAENLTLSRLLAETPDPATLAVLFDPQTAGGLLAGVPAAQAEDCLSALRALGHTEAAVIGRIEGEGQSPRAVRIALQGTL